MTAEPFGAPSPTAFQALSPDDPREVGGYRLCARLGAGGMGRVYLAYTPGGRPVALKVVRPELAEDPEFRRRFAQEVASARRIHGLYTAQVVDAGTDAATPWLATTYVPGPSLHQVIDRHGPLPERTALLLLAGIAEALQAIHLAGVVHRDLKPGNVLIAADGPRVIDFGIARAADAGSLTATGLRAGSPGFMAPEQALGLPAAPATDVFALGALLSWVASGTPPFGAGPGPAALYRAVHEEPDLTGLPADLHQVVRSCLAKDPGHRPTTAQLIEWVRSHPATGGELRFADGWLPRQVSTTILGHTELPTTPATPAPPTRRLPPDYGPPPRRRPVRTALLVTAALLVGAGGALVLLDLDEPLAPVSAVRSESPSATPTPPPSPVARPGYATVHSDLELTSPDSSYEFDLGAGKVAPQDASTWYLGRHAGEFYLPDGSAAYLAPADRLTLDDCVKGIETRPVSTLPLSSGAGFCVRSPGGTDLAIVRTLQAAPDDSGPVRIVLTSYRRTA
ncbi:serine/threonine protein kinase [Kitasatospora gansuensis]|uniref:Serine/threonine protein kinase n=1 Tax=Kitasatospora gansuensis TaxID=258050 RepID=A0A7W7SJU7_9ACTN|nr:serine/threonine-protein kinase [Kitasatospora gansuensis]MBB4951798.1 serine/threonine protein kinase [Kitasatospora gansuensis]